jgi:hypothetical protein
VIQFHSCDSHWVANVRNLRYVKGYSGQGLYENGGLPQVIGYSVLDLPLMNNLPQGYFLSSVERMSGVRWPWWYLDQATNS